MNKKKCYVLVPAEMQITKEEVRLKILIKSVMKAHLIEIPNKVDRLLFG